MINNYLLPKAFKQIGLWMILPFTAGGLYCLFGNGTELWSCNMIAIVSSEFGENTKWFTNVTSGIFDEICMIGMAVSFIFIAFAKEKIEDECIVQIRLQSLVWALIVSTCLLVFGVIFFFDFAFMDFCFAYPFFIFILFISKFHIELRKFKKNNVAQNQNE